MQRVSKRLLAWTHRLHRWTGTGLALLMLVWFASGAVMTFAGYPAYSDEERLAHGQPLVAAASLPPALLEGTLSGNRARLTMIESEARWILRDARGYRAFRAQPPWELTPLDERRARAEVERVHGVPCGGKAETIEAADQWTVGGSQPGSYPLLHFACDDQNASEFYISTRSGEIIQQTTRSERVLAWLGPIPHWIYPAALRRERELWRDVVLWLAAIGCTVTLSGLLAGAHSWWRSRSRAGSRQRQVYLCWHQRLGLAFGAAAFAWVFSGALSLEPFHWASPNSEPSSAWSQVTVPVTLQLSAAIKHCRAELPELRELELVGAGRVYAVCSDARAQTRIVDLADPLLVAQRQIPEEQLETLARGLDAQLTLARKADDYYYPTHSRPIALPYARFALNDPVRTVLYFDPARGKVLAQVDHKRRWERWLYNGLHSWDFQPLYVQPVLWRSVVISAMLVGSALSISGILIFTRRQTRRRARGTRR